MIPRERRDKCRPISPLFNLQCEAITTLRLASLASLTFSHISRNGLSTSRIGSKDGIENIRASTQQLTGHSDTLWVTLPNHRDRIGEQLLKGNCNKLAGLIKPASKRLRDLVDAGFRAFVGDGDGEVVDRDVLLGRATDRDLRVIVSAMYVRTR
jgi:hypothetical protein